MLSEPKSLVKNMKTCFLFIKSFSPILSIMFPIVMLLFSPQKPTNTHDTETIYKYTNKSLPFTVL